MEGLHRDSSHRTKARATVRAIGGEQCANLVPETHSATHSGVLRHSLWFCFSCYRGAALVQLTPHASRCSLVERELGVSWTTIGRWWVRARRRLNHGGANERRNVRHKSAKRRIDSVSTVSSPPYPSAQRSGARREPGRALSCRCPRRCRRTSCRSRRHPRCRWGWGRSPR